MTGPAFLYPHQSVWISPAHSVAEGTTSGELSASHDGIMAACYSIHHSPSWMLTIPWYNFVLFKILHWLLIKFSVRSPYYPRPLAVGVSSLIHLKFTYFPQLSQTGNLYPTCRTIDLSPNTCWLLCLCVRITFISCLEATSYHLTFN